jgi:hypothetical protein
LSVVPATFLLQRQRSHVRTDSTDSHRQRRLENTMDPNSAGEATGQTLDNLLAEDRTFPPAPEFAANANLSAEAYDRAAADPQGWWAEQARRLSTPPGSPTAN